MRIVTLLTTRITLSLTACLGCASLSPHAPPASPSAEVEAKAAEYAVPFTRGWRLTRLALDTSVASHGRMAAQVARLAQILRADTLVNGDSVMHCPGDPSTCQLRGGVGVIVAVRVDSLADSTAHATIDIRALTGLPRVPIAAQSRIVRFVRRGGVWVFDRELWIEVS